MLQATIYDRTGQKRERVTLDLRKGRVGDLILQRFQQADPQWTMRDLDALDAGTLPLSKVASLIGRDALRAAIQRRLDSLTTESDELSGLKTLLEDPDTAEAALGGDGVARRADWR